MKKLLPDPWTLKLGNRVKRDGLYVFLGGWTSGRRISSPGVRSFSGLRGQVAV